MEKKDLLNFIDDGLLEKLYGFCYARTNDSYEAEALCSDIVFALVKAAGTEGTIDDVYPFIWKVARNVYADFSEKRSRRTDLFDSRDPEEALCGIAAAEKEDMSETLSLIFRRIAFLTKAYREVMIAFYLDGFSTAAISRRLSVTESTVRQPECLPGEIRAWYARGSFPGTLSGFAAKRRKARQRSPRN